MFSGVFRVLATQRVGDDNPALSDMRDQFDWLAVGIRVTPPRVA